MDSPKWRKPVRWVVCCVVIGVATGVRCQAPTSPDADHASFADDAVKDKIDFRGKAYHTPKKYLLETMGSGVAVFDYDNDGRLDVFFANGAPISDPSPKGTVPVKGSSSDWNRLYHQRTDGTFEDVTVAAGLQGVGHNIYWKITVAERELPFFFKLRYFCNT